MLYFQGCTYFFLNLWRLVSGQYSRLYLWIIHPIEPTGKEEKCTDWNDWFQLPRTNVGAAVQWGQGGPCLEPRGFQHLLLLPCT